MSQQNSGQMIQPTNALRLKVGGGPLGAIDPAAIAKAEAALKSLASNFSQWLADEITKLEAARQNVRTAGISIETMENLYLRAHDLDLTRGGARDIPESMPVLATNSIRTCAV